MRYIVDLAPIHLHSLIVSTADLLETHQKLHFHRGNNDFISPVFVSNMQQKANFHSGESRQG